MRPIHLLLLAAVVLVACEGTPPVPDEAPTIAPTAAASEPVTIRFAAADADRKTFAPYIAAFEQANPDVRIQYTPISGSEYRALAEAADVGYVFQMPPADARPFFRDLAPFIDADAAFNAADFYPGVLAATQREGQQIMVPTTMVLPVLSYDRDLWAARGVPAPAADWTWDDLLRTAEQLAQQDNGTIQIYGLLNTSTNRLPLEVLQERIAAQTGTPLTARPPTDVQLTDAAVVTALAQTTEQVRSGALYNAEGPLDDPSALIAAGQVGMWREGSVGTDVDLTGRTIGTAAVPPRTGGESRLMGGYVMSAGSRYPDAAWRWICFLSQQRPPTVIVAPVVGRSVVLVRRSLIEGGGVLNQLDPEARAVFEQLLNRPVQPPRYFTPQDAPLSDALVNALRTAIATGDAAETVLARAQAEFETALAQPLPTTRPIDSSPVSVATPVPEPDVAADAEVVQFGVTAYRADAVRQTAQQVTGDQYTVQVNDLEPAALATVARQADCFSAVAVLDEPDALVDLRPLLDADARSILADLPAVVRQSLERDGRLYGLPLTVDVPTLDGNLALLDAAGVTLPDVGATPADLLAAAQRLTSGEGAARQYGYAAAGSLPADLDWWLRQSGVSLVDATGQPTFTAPDTIAAVESFLTLVRDTSPHTRLTGASDDLPTTEGADAIAAGRVALWLGLPTNAPVAPADHAVVRGIAPTGTAGLTSADLDVRGGYVSAQTDALRGCWAILTALSANTTGLSSGAGGPLLLPARTSIATDAAFTSSLGEDGATLAAAATVALTRATAQPPADADLPRRWFYRAVDAALQGEDLVQALARAEQETVGEMQ